MKNLIQLTTTLLLVVQTIGFSQTENTEPISQKELTTLITQQATTAIETEKFQDAVGSFLLEEGNFELEIVEEEDKMYIISPFSKDLLVQKNATTLREPTRGVDLELVGDNKNALKFTQNGYETVIKRVKPKTEKL